MRLPDLDVEFECFDHEGFKPEDFMELSPLRCSGDEIGWPQHTRTALHAREMQWRASVGRIDVKAVASIVVHDGDQTWCCRRIWWRKKEHESVSSEAARGASSGIGGTDSGSRGGPCRPVAAAAPASLREPSENPDAASVSV